MIENLLNMAIPIAFAWFISKFAKNTIPRLLWIGLGLFLISEQFFHSDKAFLNFDTLMGIGVILPHLNFFREWISQTYYELKQVTIDTYIFALTIYYKTRNFFLWFYDSYNKIHDIFTKKQNYQQEDYYQKQQNRDYSNFSQENSYERTKQRKDDDTSSYENVNNERNDTSQNNSSKQEQSKKSSSSYQDPQVQKELSLEEWLMSKQEYKHIFSESPYIVIGVSPNDDFKTMKKAYRKLAQEYHPDKHREESEKYTILFKRINDAYQRLERMHKK